MVKSIVLLTVLSVICGTFALDTNFSPVLMFTNKANTKTFPKSLISSTTPMKQSEYEQYLNGFGNNQRIVFLVTDELSPEDLSIKNEHNQRGFQNLASQVSIKQYMPYVENAADNKIVNQMGGIRYTLGTTNEVQPEPNDDARIIIVQLPECDDTESRFHCIAHIDRASYALSQSEKYQDALFILTSEMNSHLQEVHSRKARDTTATATPTGQVTKDKAFIVYFNNVTKRDTKGTDTIVTAGPATGLKTGQEITIEIPSTQNKIKLVFQRLDNEYVVLNASKSKVDDKDVTIDTEIIVPEVFSYSCASSFYLKVGKDEGYDGLYLQNFQIQFNFTNDNGAVLSNFTDSYDCVGFTSPAIWAGLFITLLLISIVSTGITFIMDIRTMDKFDDAKGKTITVNVNE